MRNTERSSFAVECCVTALVSIPSMPASVHRQAASQEDVDGLTLSLKASRYTKGFDRRSARYSLQPRNLLAPLGYLGRRQTITACATGPSYWPCPLYHVLLWRWNRHVLRITIAASSMAK